MMITLKLKPEWYKLNQRISINPTMKEIAKLNNNQITVLNEVFIHPLCQYYRTTDWIWDVNWFEPINVSGYIKRNTNINKKG